MKNRQKLIKWKQATYYREYFLKKSKLCFEGEEKPTAVGRRDV